MLGIDPRAARATWTAALVLLTIAVVYLVRSTLIVFVIALLFAYLLYPLMDMISQRFASKSRTPALAITFLLVIAVLGTLVSAVGSVAAQQAANLAKSAPALLDRVSRPAPPEDGSVQSLRQQATAAVEGQLRAHYGEIVSIVPRLTLDILSASRNLIDLILIPILSFFILRDGRAIRDGFVALFSEENRVEIEQTLADVHILLLQYMRALLLLCCSTFAVFSVVLSLMGVPYSILLAAIAFPLEFVPLVGPLAAALIILAVSAATGYTHLLWVALFLGVFRMFQDYVLSPALMSRGIELHPLLIIFGVFAGGEIGGVAGIFLSVPVLALLRLFQHRIQKIRTAQLPAG